MSLAFLLMLMFFLQNCATQPLNADVYQRQWMLVSFKDYSKETLVKNKAQLDLSPTKSPQHQYGADMGCNKMFLKAEFFQGGKVKFSDVGSTMMYCEGKMKLEDDFAKALPTMTQYSIKGHEMTLSDGKGNQMKFIAADWD